MAKTKELLPVSLQGDKNVEALCEAQDHVFSLEDEVYKLLIYPRIDSLSEEVLDLLAWQFHIEGWEMAETEEEKRALIKKAIELHKYKGTKWAVEKVLELLKLKGEVKEWFQYNGQPYRFKVEVTSATKEFNAKRVQLLYELINEHKNVRSWLEDLILIYLSKLGLWHQSSAVGESFTEARLLRETELEAKGAGWYQTAAMAEDYVAVDTNRAVENMAKSIIYQASASMAECFSYAQMS